MSGREFEHVIHAMQAVYNYNNIRLTAILSHCHTQRHMQLLTHSQTKSLAHCMCSQARGHNDQVEEQKQVHAVDSVSLEGVKRF